MKRVLLVVVVATLLVLAGCVDGVGTDVPAVETDDSLDDADSSESNDSDTENGDREVDGELEIHHIDVGQADATLLIEPSGETMLIDSGDWRQGGADVIDYLEAQDVDRIDHLVATHGHADHIGGHDEIIAFYETERDGIGTVYDSGVAATSQTYDRYLDAIEDYDVELLIVEEDDQFEFGDATVTVRNPPAGDSGSDIHDNSVVLTIEFGNFSYLTTGDAEAGAEERIAEKYGDDLDADAYQAGHHGSSTSSTTPFMNQVDPDVAIISSAYDSQYGHPHDEVLAEFADRGIETYWTAVHGDVVLTTDGDGYEVQTANEFSTDAGDILEEKPIDDDDTQDSLTHPIDVATAPLAG
ncbi:MBL fold metallo-hydrolase [Halobacteria archaeon AArc-curdl1]|uniref:MBL fold metallo-hydrolase n=1 Tax=Natronosalvus hydrolyticus TaxID=2979988 RepID=A0AAP2Z870_9EURY|nr:MBL fold metallo-hydrolase [Halobacteria archaeon AArc-curdl1]